jgi:probable F420-dependent oxidoreductase
VQFSVWPNPGRPIAEVLDLARLADEDGWHGFWFADHYMPSSGSEEPLPGDVQECWAVLPAVAAVTSRIRLGPLVSPTSVHHPALLAKRAATIDRLSGGRMVLGLGAGWQINEHRAYGIELAAPGPRVSRFEEAIRIVRSLLDEERTTFQGEYYEITDAPCEPKPVQSPLPVLVGTASPRMLRITARHAQEWNTWGTPELAGRGYAALRAACDDVGRDPATFHTSCQALVILTDDADAAERARGGHMGSRTIAGSAGALVDVLGQYAETGFDELIVPDFTMGDDAAARHDHLRELKATVLDQLT